MKGSQIERPFLLIFFFLIKSVDSITITESHPDKMGDSNRQKGLSTNKLTPTLAIIRSHKLMPAGNKETASLSLYSKTTGDIFVCI